MKRSSKPPKLQRPKTARTLVALDALEVALAHIAQLPECAESEELLMKAFMLQREVKKWTDHPPTSDEREKMMKRVLSLHIAASRL